MKFLPRNKFLKIAVTGLFGLVVILALGVILALFSGVDQPEAWEPPPSPPSLSQESGPIELVVTPTNALIDEPIQIVLNLLEPGEEVILRGMTEDSEGRVFSSWARFTAPNDGTLDLSTTPPNEGTYRSADASGLLWSMRSPSNNRFQSSYDWAMREYQISAETRRGIVRVMITRTYPWGAMTPEIIDQGNIHGELWLPKTGEPLPVIIRLGGAGGGAFRIRSSLLAARGFAVLDLLYLHGRPQTEFFAVPIDTVFEALDWLETRHELDESRVGLYGSSKGAELALLVASMDARVDAVAVWAPTSVAFEGISFQDITPGSSWTLQGNPVPYAPAQINLSALGRVVRMIAGRPISMRGGYQDALDKAPAEAFIPVEQISARILLLSGNDDRMCPCDVMANQIYDRLQEHDFRFEVENLVFDGTGHGMAHDLWPRGGEPGQFIRGGTPETNHLSGRKAWRKIIELFSEVLAPSRSEKVDSVR